MSPEPRPVPGPTPCGPSPHHPPRTGQSLVTSVPELRNRWVEEGTGVRARDVGDSEVGPTQGSVIQKKDVYGNRTGVRGGV